MKINEVVDEKRVLERKYRALKAMLHDRATTPGEKENAAKLMKKIEAKLKSQDSRHSMKQSDALKRWAGSVTSGIEKSKLKNTKLDRKDED